MSAFRPSQVILGIPPLTATMGRSEREHAAALIVRTCAAHGDEWRPVALSLIAQTIEDDIAARREPLWSLRTNPFFNPDLRGLVAEGFATCTFEPGAPIALTEKALDAIGARWVRKDGAP